MGYFYLVGIRVNGKPVYYTSKGQYTLNKRFAVKQVKCALSVYKSRKAKLIRASKNDLPRYLERNFTDSIIQELRRLHDAGCLIIMPLRVEQDDNKIETYRDKKSRLSAYAAQCIEERAIDELSDEVSELERLLERAKKNKNKMEIRLKKRLELQKKYFDASQDGTEGVAA